MQYIKLILLPLAIAVALLGFVVWQHADRSHTIQPIRNQRAALTERAAPARAEPALREQRAAGAPRLSKLEEITASPMLEANTSTAAGTSHYVHVFLIAEGLRAELLHLYAEHVPHTRPLFIHVITANNSEFCSSLCVPQWACVQYNGPALRSRLLAGIEFGSHNSAKFAYIKCAVSEIIPEGVDDIIAMDSDVRLLQTLDTLVESTHATALNTTAAAVTSDRLRAPFLFGIAAEQSLYYVRRRLEPYMWPFPGVGLNSGVVVMNLQQMRADNFGALWRRVYAINMRAHGIPTVADQDVFNAVAAAQPASYVELSCDWNYQLNHRCASPLPPKAVHALTSVGDISCLGEYVRKHLCASLPAGRPVACPRSCSTSDIYRVPFHTLGLRSRLASSETEGIVQQTAAHPAPAARSATCVGCDGALFSGVADVQCPRAHDTTALLSCDPNPLPQCACNRQTVSDFPPQPSTG